MLKEGVLRPDILDNIDDCYIDKEESDETLKGHDTMARQ